MTLEVFVTLPACRRSGNGDRGPPYPVLVFFNGFQVSSSRHCAVSLQESLVPACMLWISGNGVRRILCQFCTCRTWEVLIASGPH